MKQYSDVERNDGEKINAAIKAMSQKDFSKAYRLFEEVVINSPEEYVYSLEEGNRLFIKFWDKDEFVHYMTALSNKKDKKEVAWVSSVYPRAYYHLAYIDVQEGRYQSALAHLENCLKLEPDQPLCYCEMAVIYSKLGQHERAFSLFDKAQKVRPHITTAVKARVLRGMGVELVELKQLDFAEKCLKESLKYEPHNKLAHGELQYIYQLQSGGVDGVKAEMRPNTTDKSSACVYCGIELKEGKNFGYATKIEDRVLYTCALCSKRPNIKAELLIGELNTQHEILYRQGHYSEALEKALKSLRVAESSLEETNPMLGKVLTNLASTYKELGRYEEALPHYIQAMAIYERAMGPDHPDVAISLSNLAELYRLQGKYAEAEPLIKKAVEIKIEAFGPEHPSVANSLNNLAALYQSQGGYAEAEPLYEQVVEILLNAHGPGHPGFNISINNLAGIYSSQGKYEKAEPLLKMSLEMKEKSLGPNHPGVTVSLNNLALLYQYQDRYKEAEQLYERILKVHLDTIGQAHPDFAYCLFNLAGLFTAQGRYDKAELLYKRALEILEGTLGPDHPIVAETLRILVDFYQQQDRYAEAETFHNRLMAFKNKKN